MSETFADFKTSFSYDRYDVRRAQEIENSYRTP